MIEKENINTQEELNILTPEEEYRIKTICDFLFFDQYTDYATYSRFERCIQPLINYLNISTDRIFKELAGKKKKYITYDRFINCYLSYKYNTKILSKDIRTFFKLLMSTFLHNGNSSIGKEKEKILTFSTTKLNKNKNFISLIEVLTDKNGIIHGLNLQYDNQIKKEKLYPKTIEDKLLISLEMNLGLLINEKYQFEIKKILKEREIYYRDYVTHIFGTINKNSEIISFLGFKCASGKTVYIGSPSGEGFIFGGWGTKFHHLKIQMNEKGITYFKPIFNENPKVNIYLNNSNYYPKQYIEDNNEMILDEIYLNNLTDELEIDKFITTPIISDDFFSNPELKDEISGNDYKEIVNQEPRHWMIFNDNYVPRKFLSLNEAIRMFEKEKYQRTIYIGNKENNNNGENKDNIKMKKLHKTKKLKYISKDEEKKWNGDMDQVNPHMIFINKINYQTLKNKLAQNILDDINLNEEDSLNLKEHFIEMIIPEIAEIKGNNIFFKNNNIIPNLSQKRFKSLKYKLNLNNMNLKENIVLSFNQKKEKKIKKINKSDNIKLEESTFMTDITDVTTNTNKEENETEYENKDSQSDNQINERKEEPKKYYSAPLQLFYELSKKNYINNENEKKYNNNEDDLFGFERCFLKRTEKKQKKLEDVTGVYLYSPIIKYSCNENHLYYICENDNIKNKNKNKTYNIYDKMYSSVSNNMKNNNNPKFNYNYLLVKNKYNDEPKKVKEMQSNWKYFTKEIKRVSGVYFLQTIGTILKTIKIIKNETRLNNNLSEKIKLYKLLEENESVVEFLNKDKNGEKIEYLNINKEEDNDDFMAPDVHPEQTISLNEIEDKLRDVSILSENRFIREDQRRKIKILKNLLLQRKNIYIENETEKVKEQIINKASELNIENLIKNETLKRKKLKDIEEKNNKKKSYKTQKYHIEDHNNLLSLIGIEINNKIFRKQKLCQAAGKWTDLLFGPQTRSLCPYNSNGFLLPDGINYYDLKGWKNYKWFRPEVIFDTSNYRILPDEISLNDIVQGCINDSYFLTALIALCRYPKIIENLYFIKEKTKEHLYGIYFNIHGQWKLVLIDDIFPVIEDKYFKKFVFTHSKNNEIWLCLLEKAWAKINGCYAQIGANISTYEVFDLLTEAYTEIININKNTDINNIWEKIVDAEKKNFIIIGVTNNNPSIEKIGLVPGKSYIISKTYEINNEIENVKLLKLSNPWGNEVFAGDWSEISSKWTNELKKKIKDFDIKDGDFFMSFKDFINYYNSIGILKIHEEYLSNSIRIKKNQAKKCQMIKIKVLKECHIYLQLYQKNPRIVLSDGSYQNPVLSYLILADRKFNYIASTSSKKTHLCIECNLENGEYYLFCDINYRYIKKNKKMHGYNITSYSNNKIQFENITEKMKVKECLQKTMVSYCKKNINPNQIDNVNVYFSKSFNDNLPFIVGYFENNSHINNKVSVELKSIGDKSCCFYCDDIGNENDEFIIKDLRAKKDSFCIFLIMKYSIESLFTINYLITTDLEKLENTKKTVNNSTLKKNMLKYTYDSKKIDSNIVFNEEGQPHDIEPLLIQYFLEINNGYIIGLENKSKKKMKLRLLLEGLELTDSYYKGRDSLVFIDPKEKKTFNTVIKNRFKGDLSFKFELIKKNK